MTNVKSTQGKATSQESGGTGEAIRFVVGPSSLGWILLAVGERGAVSILVGEDPGPLVDDVRDQFPAASLDSGNRRDERLLKRVIDFVEAPAAGLDLPLDIRGTAFQRQVWEAVREIPVGETATYAEIARRIGAPKAIRAVGGACANCRLALAVPCHRVLRNDGSISGGSFWGIERRRALLDREAAAVSRKRPTPRARGG